MKRGVAALAALLPSWGQKMVLRLLTGAKFGKGSHIGFATVIWSDDIIIGRNVVVGRFGRIRTRRLELHDRVTVHEHVRITAHEVRLGPRCTIGRHTTVAGDSGDPRSTFSADDSSWIFQECYVDASRPVRMGKNVGLGGRSLIFTHGHWLSALDGYPVAAGDVTIGDNVWLPWDCFVMPGVTIGAGSVIGARSVVTQDVAPGALVAGSPARVIRERASRQMTWEEQASLLVDLTRDFARRRQSPVTVKSGDGYTAVLIDGSDVIRIHSLETPRSWSATGLNVLRTPPQDLKLGVQWWELESSTSCPERALHPTTKEWFDHARSIGLRYYPS